MANVEVQLDITADYKAAMQAIMNLGKALDAVQSRAKLVSPAGGTGSGQGGGDNADAQNKAMAERQAAVEALKEAMREASATALALASAIEKLTPAMEAMGPQAEQVQKVAELAGHYSVLAEAMSTAAEAAGKYNESGAQQGEVDNRLRQMEEENNALLEKLNGLREEVEALAEMNRELQRNRQEREQAARAAKEELESEKDLSYEMQLAAMTKQQLTEEIKRLTEERRKAAAAGEKEQATYEARTAELVLARKALMKLRQEEALMRMMWVQQAQAAHQMGVNIKTVAEGVANFSENAKNGTLNLNGMVSSVISLTYQLKAGLGPLGWVLLAVEGLTMAWNWYAKSQKAAEEAQKARIKQEVEYMQRMYEQYEQATEAARRYNEQEAQRKSINDYIEQFNELNKALRERNELTERNLRMQEAAAVLQAKEEEQQLVLERGRIMRAFWEGSITEDERDSRLDLLNVTRARQRQAHVMAGEEREVTRRQEDRENALANARKMNQLFAAVEMQSFLAPEEMEKRARAFELALQNFYSSTKLVSEYEEKIKSLEERIVADRRNGAGELILSSYVEQIQQLRKDLTYAQQRVPEAEVRYRRREQELMGVSTADIRSGEYARRYNDWKAQRDEAERRATEANEQLERSTRELANAQQRRAEQLEATTQAVRHAEQNAAESATNRAAQNAYNERRAAEAQQRREREAREREERRMRELYAEGREYARLQGREESQTLRWVMGDATRAVQSGRVSNRTAQRLLDALEEFKNTRSDVDDRILTALLEQVRKITTVDRNLRRQITDLL